MEERSSVEKSCVRFEHLLDDYYKLLSRAKIAFSDDYDDQYDYGEYNGQSIEIDPVSQQGPVSINF